LRKQQQDQQKQQQDQQKQQQDQTQIQQDRVSELLAKGEHIERQLNPTKQAQIIAMLLSLLGATGSFFSGHAVLFPIFAGSGLAFLTVIHLVWGRNDMKLLKALRGIEREVQVARLAENEKSSGSSR